VQQLGEFLDNPLLQLPRSAVKVALVYNLKTEAHTGSPLSSGHDQQLTSEALPAPLSPAVSSDTTPHTNDLYAEWDTMETVSAVRAALEERYPVTMIEANEQAFAAFLASRPDFVFNIAEGLHGVSREAQIPAMLDMLQIPYLGSNPLTLAVCLDKARTKEILAYHRIPTAPFSLIRSMEEFEEARVKFPAMVKPLHEGSSKGIYNSCVVRNVEELEREVKTVLTTYRQPALVEEFLPGREFTVALLGNGGDVRVLPIVEIRFDALPEGMNPIYSYEAKWVWDTTDRPLEIYDCPARLTPALEQEITSISLKTYAVLGCRDWSRIDVRLDGAGRPHVLEVNPLPGILPDPRDNSCFPKAARAAGMTYNQLINAALDAAMRRCGVAVSAPVRRPVASAVGS
jgi:D-alanine-D-alanine ligase